jgi:cytochrome c
MRKVFFILASLTTILIACNDSGSSSDKKKDTAATNTSSGTTDSSNTATNQKGLALVATHACFACHQVSQKVTGPAYMEVAARYPNNPAVIDSLSQKIIKGGSGNWGTIPMIAHPQVTVEEAKTMVEYILSLKQ